MQLQPPPAGANSSSGQLFSRPGSSDGTSPGSNTSTSSSTSGSGPGHKPHAAVDKQTEKSPLEVLLAAVSSRWQETRQFGPGGVAGPPGSFAELRSAWQELMAELQRQQPQLSGFARLAAANPFMHRVIARAGMPVAVFAPTNAALTAYLRQALPVTASNSSSSSSSSGNDSSSASLSQLLEAAAARPGSTILLLLRHTIPVRQQQLLDSRGTLSSHVLLTADGDAAAAAAVDPTSQSGSPQGSSYSGPGRGDSMGLLSHSLVVQTGLGSYVQVSRVTHTYADK
ncbi:hypothetical protein OEZ85_011796 [Tetradesmus obliquus]|uniref:FAS1 domain-containing protein n=1 Tax=Tetradesmus obliquus TaxID=3088 RepID=A0ABY8TRI4_TETOB|nr:hypothetical protein OEZ85_011796 [Tetradesmus obliquus]